jgi:uncharacterized membrane protein YdbT with pleckstrin-like domain
MGSNIDSTIIPAQLHNTSFASRDRAFEHTEGELTEVHEPQDIILCRSALNDLPLLILFVVCGTMFQIVASASSLPSLFIRDFDISTRIAPILAGIGISLVALVVFRRFNVRYVIDEDGIKALRGILSNNQVDSKLEYYQIRGMEIHRTLFQRLISTGDLHLRGATGNDTEVCFKGILYPYRVQKIIQQRHRLQGVDYRAQGEQEYRSENYAGIPRRI